MLPLFDMVVPVLQRRGIYRTAYEERTLRETWVCRSRRAALAGSVRFP